jgi:hypothetical protein
MIHQKNAEHVREAMVINTPQSHTKDLSLINNAKQANSTRSSHEIWLLSLSISPYKAVKTLKME